MVERSLNRTELLSLRPIGALLWACIAVATVFRLVALDHLPGINGDEAYLGSKVLLFLQGDEISLRTGSQLPPEPLSFALSALLHLVAPISFTTLRLPVALTGTLAIIASFVLYRRLWGARAALLIAALIACLPIHIAYARFFWEPSQTPLFAVLFLYGLARRHVAGTLAALAAALLAHPTNAFLLPIAVVPALGAAGTWIRQAVARARDGDRGRLAALVLALAGSLALIELATRRVAPGPAFAQVLERCRDPEAFALFWNAHAWLLDGSTIYAYIVGAPAEAGIVHPTLVVALVFWLPVAVALRVGGDRFLRELALGLTGSLALYYLIVGPIGLAPALERYGLWMTVPHCVLLGLSLHRIAERMIRPVWVELATGLLAATLLTQFGFSYFASLRAQNSRSEKTFMTGPTEPKQRAFEAILAERDPSRGLRILAEDWWTYWPLEYLSLGHPDIEVSIPGQAWDRRFPHGFVLVPAGPDTQVFRVGFAGSGLGIRLAREEPGWRASTVEGYGSKPILNVFAEPER